MGQKKLFIAVCGIFREELAAVAGSAGFENILPLTACSSCQDGSFSWYEIESQLPPRSYANVHVYVCKSMEEMGPPPQRLELSVVHRVANFAELVAGKDMVARCISRRKWPLTPGLLAQRLEQIGRAGLSPSDSARYAEKYTGLTLFDTGVNPESETLLKELAARMGLPCETVYVGLDYFRLTLAANAERYELSRDLAETRASLAERRSLLSNYTVALEFIAGMTGHKNEQDIIKQLFVLFNRLFEPERISIMTFPASGSPALVNMPPCPDDTNRITARMLNPADFYQINETGFGFKISGNGATLAAVEVDGVKHSERINYFLNLSFLVARVCGLGIENTRRYGIVRAAQDRLEVQYRHFISLLNNIDSAVVVFDAETRKLVFVNRFAEGMFGPPAERDYAAFLGSDSINFPSADSADIPFSFYSASSRRWYIAVTRWISWWDGRDVILLTGTDITELKEATERADKAKRASDAANRAKSDFLSGMSHEIRNPLNVVCNMVLLLSETELAPEQKTFIQVLRNASENLLLIANDILDLAKIESGRMTLEATDFNLRQLVESIHGMMSLKAERKGIELRLKMDPQVPPSVVTDSTRLRQILFNLVDNAIKFTDKGYVELSVAVAQAAPGGQLRFTVTDTGTGIPADKMPMLFAKFSQLHTGSGKVYGGTGLGLNLSLQFARLMGGNITASSVEKEGSRFCLEVPFEAGTGAAAPAAVPQQDFTGRKLKIMVVEDSRDNVLIIRAFLKKTPHTLMECVDGSKAVEAYKSEKFDLILMDIQMPVMDGYTAIEHIRRYERENNLPATPIVVLSAYTTAEEQRRALDLGCDRYLTKPLTRAGVLDLVAFYAAK